MAERGQAPVVRAPRSVFVGGTASHVGKSWFTAAICRTLKRRGVRVAPFKAQNMSNNSYPCIEGGEIGRAQATQAEACGLPAMADMNPVLLKPNSATGSQVVVQGRVWKTVDAWAYGDHTEYLFGKAMESYQRLVSQFECVICEGAGSVAEVNLFSRDITNLRFAEAAGARALLVADIERGGVFASLVGTMELLPESQRRLVKAFAVNRFRGDLRLFDEGVRFLEQRLQIPCLGVFPWQPSIRIDDEDSLSLDDVPAPCGREVAVIRLPRISNFTDFRSLGPVDWIQQPPKNHVYRVVFLPGTKNTIEDLLWLREQRLDAWIVEQHRRGALIVGICGGFQMLGQRIDDPLGVESQHGSVSGLGLIAATTTLQAEKVTRVVNAVSASGCSFPAYEIHMGTTSVAVTLPPFATLATGEREGCRAPGVIGTYLHGAFDMPAVVAEYLGMDVSGAPKEGHYDQLADWLEKHAKPAVLRELIG